MRNLPGSVSADIHKSLDGRRVANYAQWRRQGDFRAMLANPEAQVHVKAAEVLARLEPGLYRVAFSDSVENE